MSADRLSAVIAGGGIGGLATALALARHGIESHVCERRVAPPEEGAGIQIGPNGTRILRAIGVADLLQDSVAVPDVLSVRDSATARELTRLPLGTWIEERHGAPYWTAHRKDLHAALRRRVEAEPLTTLTRGLEIVSFENEGNGVRALSTEGDVLRASLLVAADGLWSKLRPQIAFRGRPAPIPVPVGKSAFRAVVAADRLPAGLTPNAVHIWLAPGVHAVHYPVSGGRDIALVVIADDPSKSADWDAPAATRAVHEKVRGFAGPLRALVGEARHWRHWSLHGVAPLERWTSGRAALLGDAAHPMLPFFAQGAVMALEDAIMLATQLAGAGDGVENRLRAYDDARRPRVECVVAASRRNGLIYHMHGATAVARNAVMKFVPPARMMAGFDWLYGWRP
jgi:salicylate hydroxylase